MAPNGKTKVMWLSYQPLIASKPYPTITVSTGNCPRNFGPTQIVLFELPGEIGTPVCPSGMYRQSSNLSRSFGTSPISLTLSLYTEWNAHSVVICKGVGSKQHTSLTRQFQRNRVRTDECVQHGQNQPALDGMVPAPVAKVGIENEINDAQGAQNRTKK